MSHNGLSFARVTDRTPVIPASPIGTWDRFNHSLANSSPVLVGDKLRFYDGSRTYRHTPYKGKDTGSGRGGIGLATMKKDHFVSLQPSFDGGEILTKPLKVAGSDLHVNAKSDFGEIWWRHLTLQAIVSPSRGLFEVTTLILQSIGSAAA